MNTHTFYTRRALGVLLLFVVLGLVAAFYSFNNFIYQEKQGAGDTFEPYRASLSGEYVCLSYTDTREQEPDECVVGLKTEIGEYYGIDFNLMSQTHEPPAVGQKISANGVIVPVERLSTDQWRKYGVAGIFSVTDSLTILNDENLNQITVSLGGSATVMHVTVSPQEVTSDSRCPAAVQCVWAGTVNVRTVLATEVAHGEHILTLGEPQVFGEYTITLIEVSPVKTQEAISGSEYRFTYKVDK